MSKFYVESWVNAQNGYLKLEKEEASLNDVADQAESIMLEMVCLLNENIATHAEWSKGPTGGFFNHIGGYKAKDIMGRRTHITLVKVVACNVAHDSETATDIADFTNDLETMIQAQSCFVDACRQGNLKGGTHYVSATSPRMLSSRVFQGKLCDDCGDVVSASAHAAHRQSLKCMKDTSDRDLRDTGWVELNTSSHISAAKNANIQLEIRPTGYALWAPEWVGNALTSYDNMYRNGNGFADMKLSEFLTKMKPNNS